MATHYLRIGELDFSGSAADAYSVSQKSQADRENELDQNERRSLMMLRLAEIISEASFGGEKEKTAGHHRPPLASINTTNSTYIPQPQSVFQLSPENQFSEIFFPGLNTPQELLGHEPTASSLTVEGLCKLADLLSPLRNHSNTAGSQKQYRHPPDTAHSAGSQTRSYTSSFGHPLEQCISPQGNTSDPGPKYRGDGWDYTVPVVSYRSAPSSPKYSRPFPLHVWGMSPSRSYFELYKPMNVRYPSVWEFSDIRSPVVRVNSSAVHSNFSVIWRKIEIAFAQEIWQWGNTFDKILDHTLFKLSALSRKQEYITTKSHAVWRIHRYNLKTLVKILRFLYFRQYGNPVWATTEEDVIQFLNTIDTCCSREVREDAEDDYGVKEDAQVERSVEVSMKFGADDAQVRRYMRQIVIDPSHIYATAGEEFGIKLTIWDPHQTFEQLKGTTTFALDPEIPWLKYNAKTHTFSGQVPEDLGDHITSESGRLTHYKLELGFIAKITDTLPKGPERETTIRAKVNIWVQNDGQSANSLFNDLQQLSDIPVFFTTSPTPCVSDNGEAAATARCGEETEYEEQPSFSFVRMNDSYGNMDNTSFEHMDHTLGAPSSPYEAFVAAMLPKFWEGTPAPEHHFFPYEDSFSSVAPGEVYEETGLDSWMQNAMIARELSRSWGQAVRQETTPSDLAQRNEFWDLSTLSPEERSRHALRSFSYQNPSDELDGYEAEENQIVSYDSVDEACLCLDGLVDNKPFLDGYFGKLEDKGDEGCTRSEASVLATEGCLSPQNSDYDDYYEECEMMQTLGRGGPRL